MIKKLTKSFILLAILVASTLIHSNQFPSKKISIIPTYKNNSLNGLLMIDQINKNIYLAENAKDSPLNIKFKLTAENIDTPFNIEKSNESIPRNLLIREIKDDNGNASDFILVNPYEYAISYIINYGKDGLKKTLINENCIKTIYLKDSVYELFIRYSKSGKTIGAYLCNINKGDCLYFNEIEKMHKEYCPSEAKDIFKFSGNVSVAEIHTGLKGPRFYLVIDNEVIEMYWIESHMYNPTKLYCRKENIRLQKIFSKQKIPKYFKRFLIIPILTFGDSTWNAIIIDTISGKSAIFNIHDYKKWDFKEIEQNIYSYFQKKTDITNDIITIPIVLKGFTKAAWLFNLTTDQVIHIKNIDKDNINEIKIELAKFEIISK